MHLIFTKSKSLTECLCSDPHHEPHEKIITSDKVHSVGNKLLEFIITIIFFFSSSRVCSLNWSFRSWHAPQRVDDAPDENKTTELKWEEMEVEEGKKYSHARGNLISSWLLFLPFARQDLHPNYSVDNEIQEVIVECFQKIESFYSSA